MNESLKLEPGQKVLEIGSGSGWHAATVAEIIAPSELDEKSGGHIYTLEIIPELAEFARQNIENSGYNDRITIICRDGSEGFEKEAPYDRILVTAAAPRIPDPLIRQLKSGGLMVIPVGQRFSFQTLFRIKKINGEVYKENLGGVAFVPLVGKHGHSS
jgi:protein-L-isoaspartate(D-aspartate) O-methyltransferase